MPNNFADLDALERHLLSFGRRYEQIVTPVEWKFTRRDLERQLARLHSQLSGESEGDRRQARRWLGSFLTFGLLDVF